MSLKDVENLTGISASYLLRLEDSKKLSPSLGLIENLARCYRRPPEELFRMALNGNYYTEKTPLFETVIYDNRFILGGKEADNKTKKALIDLVNGIMKAVWSNDTKVKEAFLIVDEIEKFKKCIS
jgi:transcriptional regulator with XRE-family HTH domain